MNKTSSVTSEIRAEQVTNSQCEAIYLGVDLHKQKLAVCRILDHSTPQPSQIFTWEKFWLFVQNQTKLAKKVYVVYEAGAFGFWPARKLKALGLECYVIHPEKLDPRHKRVQTDKLDARHLADKLQRYVLGNKRAMVPVYIPTETEERLRIESRHRRSLCQELRRLQRRGAGLLLGQGHFENQHWWTEPQWQKLHGQLSPELRAALEDDRALISDLEKRVQTVHKKLEATAPKSLPTGLGRLTFVLLMREICNYGRFGSRRNVGGFTGLCGAVSSSGPYHVDLSINKAGSPFVRTELVEAAWRMTYWQRGYSGLKVWNRLARGGRLRNGAARKRAIVAVARQLAVDLWKWQTGRITPAELGWEMTEAA